MKMTHQQRAERRLAIATRVKNGADISDVCVEFGVTRWTAINACIEHGVPYSEARSTYRIDRSRGAFNVLAELLDGRTVAEVARRMQVRVGRVERVHAAALEAGIALPIFASMSTSKKRKRRVAR